MNFIPYPAEAAAESKRLALEATQAQRTRGLPRLGERRERRGLAFRMPDGALRPVHDPYRPAYPEGATPGWAMIGATLRAYENETHGYTFDVTGFESL